MIVLNGIELINLTKDIIPLILDVKYDASTALKLTVIIKQLRDNYERIFNAQKEISEAINADNSIVDKQTAIEAKLEELLEEKIEIKAKKLSINCLQGLELTPRQAITASLLFEEENEND